MTSTPRQDDLDCVVDLETQFEKEGRQAAAAAGAAAGHREGRQLGWSSAHSLCSELEFYHGAAVAIVSLQTSFPNRVNRSAKKAAEAIMAHCQRTPLGVVGNDESVDMHALVSEVRNLFKHMMAVQGLVGVRFDSHHSKLSDLSF